MPHSFCHGAMQLLNGQMFLSSCDSIRHVRVVWARATKTESHWSISSYSQDTPRTPHYRPTLDKARTVSEPMDGTASEAGDIM